MRILVVDDEISFLEGMKYSLSYFGHSVITADQVDDALTVLKTQRIDVGIFDVNIKNDSGVTLLSKAKIIQPETFYVIVTGMSDTWTSKESELCGAICFINKPINISLMKETLEKIERMRSV